MPTESGPRCPAAILPRVRARRAVVWAMLSATACLVWISITSAQTPSTDAAFGERATFRLNKAELRAQGASPALLEKAGSTAYRYFRAVARPFAARTCYEFRDLRWRLPSVAVHGDAHIEQFMVTNEAYRPHRFRPGRIRAGRRGHGPVRGLDSCGLPEAKWSCDAPQAVAAYFDAYRASLDHPETRTRPSIVDRVRVGLPQDPRTWLQWADNLMRPMPAADEQAFRDGWFRFVDLMAETSPDRPRTFYGISRVGRVEIGIGSALDPKTLIRIDGPSDAPEDDVILEARITATPDGRDCVSRPPNGGSLDVPCRVPARTAVARGIRVRLARRARGAGTLDSVVGPWVPRAVSRRSPHAKRT